jgi:hypothetical protein
MPPRRLQVGAARGPRLVGLIAAVLLVAALIITGRVQSGAERQPPAPPDRTDAAAAPYRIGSSFRCPLGRPVLAMSSGNSYPPGHPARPLQGTTAVACYQTVEQASTAGYLPAPLPAGTDEVFGVYLVPTDRAFCSRCQLAADRLGFAVPCPGLLPTSAPGTALPELCGQEFPCDRGRGFFFRQEGFEVPPGYLGVDKQPQGSLEITAFPADKPTRAVNIACETERRIATVPVQGSRAVLVGCPGWSSSGQVTLRWWQAGALVSVSLQGAGVANQQLLIALAIHLRLVRPMTRGPVACSPRLPWRTGCPIAP